jgi:hypothetical protein
VTTTALGCDLCTGSHLPQTDALADVGFYSVNYSPAGPAVAGASEWLRTSPLDGRGFLGVIGTGFVDGSGVQQPWPPDFPPFRNYPELGLANYGTGLTDADFPLKYVDGSGIRWSVRFAADEAALLWTNVTVVPVPEPDVGLISMVGLAVVSTIRRIRKG